MTIIKRRIIQLKTLILVYIFRLIGIFYRPRRSVWLIGERGNDARDNGYFFYKYMKEQHPDIKVYYYIKSSSPDYWKVEEDAVEYGSVKSIFLSVICDKIVSSHYALVIPNFRGKLFRLSGLWRKFYFLQHGVIKDYLASLAAKRAPMNLFICGAFPEYQYILKEFGFTESVVKYTGLARFDSLLDNKVSEKQILVMPTWRGYITEKEDFLESAYFHRWNELLNNKRLDKLLKESNYRLVFYPHYEMQKFISEFEQTSEYITYASFKEYDVQQLLKESRLLITDYSSVFFDFAYMEKPVIYYQFDSEDFFQRQYSKGYFDYNIHGFGPVCNECHDLIEQIERYLQSDCTIEEQFRNRIDGFYPLRDDKNCDRIFSEIINKS